MKRWIVLVLVLALLMTTTGLAAAQRVRVGAKGFVEQLVIGEMMAMLLEENGFTVDLREGLGTVVLREALETGEIDLYAEYDGTAWTVFYSEEEILPREEQYQKVKERDLDQYDLVWLDAAPVNNTYCIVVRQEFVDETGITNLSDFAEYVNEQDGRVRFATDHEFLYRPDGIPGMENVYDFSWNRNDILTVSFGVTHMLLNEEEVEAAMAFGTDPQIARWNFYVLEDDRNFFPYYDLAPVVRAQVLEEHPVLEDLLNDLFNRIDAQTMREINAWVEFDDLEPDEAAEEFLLQEGLLN